MSDMDLKNRVKLFGLDNLLLESTLSQIEKDGIEIGHANTLKKENIIDVEVFESDIRTQAKQMTELYYLHFCLENSIRRLISTRLRERYGTNWWEVRVPERVKTKVIRMQRNEKDTPFSERSEEKIFYTDFKDLIDIIEESWDDFSDTFRSMESVRSALTTLNILRRPIAHSALLNEDEILRFKLNIKDWIRIQM